MRRWALTLSGWALWAALAPAAAASPPVAGTLLRDIESAPWAAPGRMPPPRVPAPDRPLGPRVLVKSVSVTGSTVYAAKDLEAVFADTLNREMTWEEFAQTAERIRLLYNAVHAGYLEVHVLPQTPETGVARVQVADGYLRDLEAKASPQARIPEERAVRTLLAAQPSGAQPLRVGGVERALLLLDELPGVDAYPVFQPGRVPGATTVAVMIEPEPLVEGLVEADNHGNRYTGEQRLGATLAVQSPFGGGERFALRGLFSSEAQYGRFSFDLPVGYGGLAAGLNASWLRYELGRELEDLDADGQALSGGVFASYPLVRQRGGNLFLTLAFDEKRYWGERAGEPAGEGKTREVLLAADADWRDGLFSGGSVKFLGKAVAGNWQPDDAQDESNRGGFVKFTFDASRLQALRGDATALHVWLRGQYALDGLDGSEQFTLGGPGGVRAYPVGEGAGDTGFLATVELRQELPHGLRAFGFYDCGWIHRRGKGGDADAPGSYGLYDTGLGVGKEVAGFWSVQVMAAQRLGGNPAAEGGRDGDGTKRQPRFWLRAAVHF